MTPKKLVPILTQRILFPLLVTGFKYVKLAIRDSLKHLSLGLAAPVLQDFL